MPVTIDYKNLKRERTFIDPRKNPNEGNEIDPKQFSKIRKPDMGANRGTPPV